MCGPAGSCDHDEGKRRTTSTLLFNGIDNVNEEIQKLIIKKVWFSVEPLPTKDERYYITVKSKDVKRLRSEGFEYV